MADFLWGTLDFSYLVSTHKGMKAFSYNKKILAMNPVFWVK